MTYIIIIFLSITYLIFLLTKLHHEKRMRYWRSKEKEHLADYYIECMESWYDLQMKLFKEKL